MLRRAIIGKEGSFDSDKNRFELIREISISKFHFRNQMKFLENVKNDLLQIWNAFFQMSETFTKSLISHVKDAENQINNIVHI